MEFREEFEELQDTVDHLHATVLETKYASISRERKVAQLEVKTDYQEKEIAELKKMSEAFNNHMQQLQGVMTFMKRVAGAVGFILILAQLFQLWKG